MKRIQLPKEQAIEPDGAAAKRVTDDDDVEGHGLPRGTSADDLSPRMPSSGGEVTDGVGPDEAVKKH